MDPTAGDSLHVALFSGVLATFAGSPLRGPTGRLVGAGAGGALAALLCRALGAPELWPLAAGLGALLAFAGPALGSRPRQRRHSPGRLLAGLDSGVGGSLPGAGGGWR